MATYKKDELETGKTTANAAENLQLSDQKSDGFSYKAYEPSDAVKLAQQQLQTQLSQKPGAYQSQWQTQLNDTIGKILNREKFSYDLNGDALYQQYKDQYVTQGKMAMMDTMGQAQTMTGGYGNSYAQSVGQQAYQGYLQQLNDKIPELWQLALSKYQMEGDQMYDQAALMAQMEGQDYDRYRDQLGDWQTGMDYLTGRYDTERDYDYGMWADDRDFSYQKYLQDAQQEQEKLEGAAALMADVGDYSLLGQLYGLTPEQLAKLQGGGNGREVGKPGGVEVDLSELFAATGGKVTNKALWDSYVALYGADALAAAGIVYEEELSGGGGKDTGGRGGSAGDPYHYVY